MPAAGIASRPYRPLPPREPDEGQVDLTGLSAAERNRAVAQARRRNARDSASQAPAPAVTPLGAAPAPTLPQQPYQPLPPRTDIRPAGMSQRPAGGGRPGRPRGTVLGSAETAEAQRREAEFFAEFGANPRLGGEAGRKPGETIGQFNHRIAVWDNRRNRALGRGYSQGHVEGDLWIPNDPELEQRLYGDAAGAGGEAGGAGAGPPDADPNDPGAGGGGPGGGPQRPWSLDSATEDYIRQLMSGEGGPYTGEVVGGLTADAAARRSADLANTNRNLTLAAARGGVAGPAQQALAASAEREARGGLSSDVTGIKREATLQNHAARVQGLQAGLSELANRRARDIARAQNETEKEAIARRYEAEMADIKARLEISQNELSQQERLQEAANAAAARGGSAAWNRELEMFNLRNERADFEYNRDLPFQLYQYGQQAVGDNFVY